MQYPLIFVFGEDAYLFLGIFQRRNRPAAPVVLLPAIAHGRDVAHGDRPDPIAAVGRIDQLAQRLNAVKHPGSRRGRDDYAPLVGPAARSLPDRNRARVRPARAARRPHGTGPAVSASRSARCPSATLSHPSERRSAHRSASRRRKSLLRRRSISGRSVARRDRNRVRRDIPRPDKGPAATCRPRTARAVGLPPGRPELSVRPPARIKQIASFIGSV